EMVNAAVRIALQKGGDGRSVSERAQELDLGVGQFDEHRGDAVLRLIDRGRDLRSQRVAIDLGRSLEIGNGDGNVVQTSDHRTALLSSFICSLSNAPSRVAPPRPVL